jgi:Adenomatosis polyposis coli down-regulated 1
MKILHAVILFLFSVSIVKAHPVATVEQLAGIWKSPAAEHAGNGNYSTREFTFTEKSWKVEAVFYGDQELRVRLFSFTAEGPYRLGDVSSVVAGATNAVFSFSKKSLTLLSSDPAVTSHFNLGNCNLVVGVSKDISHTGCSFFTSISECAQEYDLVQIDDHTLRLGKRPADRNMCIEEKRPKALGLPVKKKNS